MAILYLGSRKISPIARAKIYGVDGYNWLGEIDANGVLIKPVGTFDLVFNGVREINSNILYEKFYKDNRVTSVSFPDLITISGDSLMLSTFNCFDIVSNLESVDFPELEYVSGNSTMYDTFAHNNKLVSINLPKLKRVSGAYDPAFYGTFRDCANLREVYLPSLEYIGSNSRYPSIAYTFSDCTLLELVYLPNLREIGAGGFCGSFYGCTSLTTIGFPNLTYVGLEGLNMAFEDSGIETMSFPELTTVSELSSLYRTYAGCSSLETLYFPKLTTIEPSPDPEIVTPRPFYGMLENCSDVTVHFNADFEDIIGDSQDVLAGFGGTNTTILFDLNGCYADITVVGTSDYNIYVGGKEKVSPFITGTTSKEYTVYDNTNNRVFFGMLTGLAIGETSYFTADVTQATNKITLAIGTAGLNVTVSYAGQPVPLNDEGDGNYSFYTMGTGHQFSYVIAETQTTRETSGTITTTGADLTTQITPTPKAWEAFIRPNLTADGTLGGSSFAVASSGTYSASSSYKAYRAVDGNTSTSYYWYSSNIANPTYTFYNPSELKLTSLSFRWTNTSYRATNVVVEGSNDNSNWVSLGTYDLASATTATATINATTPYKYFRLTFTKSGTYIRMVELTMVATEYK